MNTTPEFMGAGGNNVFMSGGRVRPIWRFLISVIIVIAANLLGGMISYALFRGHPLATDAGYRLFSTVAMVAGFALLLRYLDRVERDLLGAQGLPLRRYAVRESLIGAALGFGLVSACVAAIAVFGKLEIGATVNPTTARHALTVTVLLLAGAMLEEVMFRGYPFQRLVEAIRPVGAILLLSVLFGAVHLGNPNAGGIRSWAFFNTITVGALLALAYLRTGALWVPFGFHFAWNFSLGVLYGLPVSGISMFSVVVRSKADGSKLLTGGAYGIENSLTAAIAIVIGIGIVLILPKRAEIPVTAVDQFGVPAAPESPAEPPPAGI